MGHVVDQVVSVWAGTATEGLEGVCLFGGWDAAALDWVTKNTARLLVVIEEDAVAFLKTKMSILGEHPQVRVFCYRKGDDEGLKRIAWECVFLRLGCFVMLPADESRAQECFSALNYYHQGVDLVASEYRDRGVGVLCNVLQNLSYLPVSKRGLSLEGVCKGMTAIVCGAGPSLNQVAPLLAKASERALIIAGGSAIKALNLWGIRPHLSVAVDPDPSRQRFLQQDEFTSPFFYQSRFSHALLECVSGPLIWMPSQSVLSLESYALGQCGLFSEPFDAGWTVVNFCTALAHHLGCETILFTGVDFVCKKEEVYASKMQEGKPEGLIALAQEGLYSRKDWLMSAEWTRSFVKKHASVQWFNLTTAASDLLGVPLLSLQHWLELPFVQEDIEARVHAMVMQAEPTGVLQERGCLVRETIRRSFEAGLSCCDELIALWQGHYPHSPLEESAYILKQQDLEQEICYEQCLAPLWEVWKFVILRAEHHPLGKQLQRLLFLKSTIEIYLDGVFKS